MVQQKKQYVRKEKPPKSHINFADFDWYNLLPRMGIDERYLKRSHGPCPVCISKGGDGGKDRFRFDNKFSTGNYFCSTCGAGNAWNLLKACSGMSEPQIMAELENELERNGKSKSSGERPVARIYVETELTPEQIARNRPKLKKVQDGSVAITKDDPVWRYMAKRVPGCDLTKIGKHVKYHPSLDFWENEDVTVGGKTQSRYVFRGSFPAMVTTAVDSKGNPITLHRTYLTKDGDKAPFKMVKKQMGGVRTLKGAAIHLFDRPEDGTPGSRTLGICEGNETGWAIATAYRYSINVWSLLNAGNLGVADIPEGRFDKVIIFADHDKIDIHRTFQDGEHGPDTAIGKLLAERGYRPGEFWATVLKEKLLARGIPCELKTPRTEGTDFADEWIAYYNQRVATAKQMAAQETPKVTLQKTPKESTPCHIPTKPTPLQAQQSPSRWAGTAR